jgi:hypothetical protein
MEYQEGDTMNTYEIEKLPGEPILVHTMLEGWSVADDLPANIDQAVEHLDAANEPLYYIANFSNGLKLDLKDVILAANQAARGGNAMFHHPNFRELLVVTDARLLDLAAKGLDSEVFGNVPVAVFGALEEALAYARAGG